jgi:hypothetical protein
MNPGRETASCNHGVAVLEGGSYPRLRRSGRRLVPSALPWADLWLALRAEELLPPRPTSSMPSLRDSAIVLGERSRRLRAWLSNATAPPFRNTGQCHRSAVQNGALYPRRCRGLICGWPSGPKNSCHLVPHTQCHRSAILRFRDRVGRAFQALTRLAIECHGSAVPEYWPMPRRCRSGILANATAPPFRTASCTHGVAVG